jgi:hypothetical protein
MINQNLEEAPFLMLNSILSLFRNVYVCLYVHVCQHKSNAFAGLFAHITFLRLSSITDHVHMYKCLFVCMYVYMYVYIYIYTFTYIIFYSPSHTHTHICICPKQIPKSKAYMCVYICTYMHIYIYIYIYISMYRFHIFLK